MPKIRKEATLSSKYREVQVSKGITNDTNDCTVKALAILGGVEYSVAHEMLRKRGRKNGHGTYLTHVSRSLEELGFTVRSVTFLEQRAKIAQYPGAHKNLNNITSHHPRRFNKVWRDGKSYLMSSGKHCWAVIDGTTHDWSVNSSLRAHVIYEISRW